MGRRLGVHPVTVRKTLLDRGVATRRPDPPRDAPCRAELFGVWFRVRQRCFDPSHPLYPRYGGRGVGLCEPWRKFAGFYRWAMAKRFRAGLRLLLVDPTADYAPASCRWITDRERIARRFRTRPPPAKHLVEAFGETKGVKAWARDPRCRVTFRTLSGRLNRSGWRAERAITTPPTRPDSHRARPARRRGGRKRVIGDEAVRLHLEEHLSPNQIAARLGVSHGGVRKALRALGVYRRRPPARRLDRVGRSIYGTWSNLRRRAEAIADEWESFERFLSWARASGFRRGLCLARIDRRAAYGPANCTWVTRREVHRGARPPIRRPPSRWTLKAFGETQGLCAWARDRRCEVSVAQLRRRLYAGMPLKDALTKSPAHGGSVETAESVFAFGERKTLAQWVRDRRCRVTMGGLLGRLAAGLEPERALKTPPWRLHVGR